MKTPEQVLTEYVSDSVKCFHGHRVEWESFEECCNLFRVVHYGIYPCFGKILRFCGFGDERVKAIQAASDLIRLPKFDLFAIQLGFDLSQSLQGKYATLFDPLHLLRYESEREALDAFPSIDGDIQACLKRKGQSEREVVELAEDTYRTYQKIHIVSVLMREPAKKSSFHSLGKIHLTVFRGDLGGSEDISSPLRNFLGYIGNLIGMEVTEMFFPPENRLEFCIPPASLRIRTVKNGERNLLLHSLVTYELL